MTIWQLLADKKITSTQAMKIFRQGKPVGVLATRCATGIMFNPAYRDALHKTSMTDAQNDAQAIEGTDGLTEWYDLSEWADKLVFDTAQTEHFQAENLVD